MQPKTFFAQHTVNDKLMGMVLGRSGYLSMNAVAGMNDVAAVKAAVPPQIDVLATAILVTSLILLAVGTLYRRKREI